MNATEWSALMIGALILGVNAQVGLSIHVQPILHDDVVRERRECGGLEVQHGSILEAPAKHPYFTPSAFSIARHEVVLVQFVTSPSIFAVSGLP